MLTLEKIQIEQGDFRLSADFSIGPGKLVAVIGPSGGGKSTLLNTVSGFVMPTAGRIFINQIDVTFVPPGERLVAMIFQDSNLFPHLSVMQNVGLAIRPSLRLSPDEQAQVKQALSRVGLAGLEMRKPSALSGGQQSRVALARVLLQDATLLLLDEPFAALGPALKAEMLDLIQEIVQEKELTLLMVTHDPADAKRIADQAVLVDGGIASPPQDVAELFANPPEGLRDYLGT